MRKVIRFFIRNKIFLFNTLLFFVLLSFISCANEESIEQTISLEAVNNSGRTLESLTLNAEIIEIIDGGKTIQVNIKFKDSDINSISKFTRKYIDNQMVTSVGGKKIFSGLIKEEIVDGKLSMNLRREKAPEFIQRILKETDKTAENRKQSTTGKDNRPTNINYKLSHDEFAQGNIFNAIKYAQKSVEIEPNNVMNRMWLANLYAENNDIMRSIKEFEKAKEYVDDNILNYPGLLLSLGDLYMNAGNYRLSLANYQVLLESNNLKARHGVAKAYEKMGDRDAAIKEYTILSQSDDSRFKEIGRKAVKRLNKDT